MLYRLYQPADFNPLYAVEEICFKPPFRFGRGYMRQLVLSSDAATWIAEENGELVGFAIVEWSGESAYIQTVEVTPARRGEGIGRELMNRIEESAHAAGAHTIWLHVDVENAPAIRLYESRGYTRQGREEHYYARQRAAFIYAKPLSDGNVLAPSPSVP
jgi:[ribosomal protein S18]-alanine N-acetyltransferase